MSMNQATPMPLMKLSIGEVANNALISGLVCVYFYRDLPVKVTAQVYSLVEDKFKFVDLDLSPAEVIEYSRLFGALLTEVLNNHVNAAMRVIEYAYTGYFTRELKELVRGVVPAWLVRPEKPARPAQEKRGGMFSAIGRDTTVSVWATDEDAYTWEPEDSDDSAAMGALE